MRTLVTGAAGGVAKLLVPGLVRPGETATLRLTDQRKLPGPPPGAEVVRGDLTDSGFAAAVVAGMDTVVHLAANPEPAAAWPELSGPNVDAVVALLEAARAGGVARVVLASSVHAMGGYYRPDRFPIDPDWPPYPCCAYGATKVVGEAIGRVYAESGELSVICLRLGGPANEPLAASWLPGWLSVADLRQLVRCALTAEVRFGVYFGCSANTRLGFDITSARRDLGYAPVDDAETYLDRFDADPGPPGLCLVSPEVATALRQWVTAAQPTNPVC